MKASVSVSASVQESWPCMVGRDIENAAAVAVEEDWGMGMVWDIAVEVAAVVM